MRTRNTLCVLLTATMAACAQSIQVDSMVTPAASIEPGQSYSWRAGSGGIHGDARTDGNPMLDRAIKDAINEALQARGFVLEATGGDLGVAYVAAIDQEMDVAEVNDFLRYRRNTYIVTRTEIREFDLGSLVIDFTDGSTGELMWRGVAEAELHRDDRDYREARLRAGIDAILEALP